MLNLNDYMKKNSNKVCSPTKKYATKKTQTEQEIEECCVCFENEYLTYTNCNHPICCTCLISLPNISCPMCRKTLILPKDIRRIIMKKNELREKIANNETIDVSNQEQFPPL